MKWHLTTVVLAGLSVINVAAVAEGDPSGPASAEHGKLLLRDDFTAKVVGPPPTNPKGFASGFTGWRFSAGRWDVADGALTGVELEADHHPAHAAYGLTFQDIILECEVRLEGCRMTRVRSTDADDYVWSVRMTPDGVSLFKDDHDHDGPDRDVPLARVDRPIQAGTWYPLRIETRGTRITATFDGRSLGGSHPKIGGEKKSLRLAVLKGGASYRRLRVWEAPPARADQP